MGGKWGDFPKPGIENVFAGLFCFPFSLCLPAEVRHIKRRRAPCLPAAVGMSNVGGLYACPPKISLLNAGGRYAFLRLEFFMNSYLVRIYRKSDNNPRMLVGVVEEPGVKEKKAFHTLYELWDILNPNKKEKQTKQRKTEGNGMGRAYSKAKNSISAKGNK
jgi:hypothetical protein